MPPGVPTVRSGGQAGTQAPGGEHPGNRMDVGVGADLWPGVSKGPHFVCGTAVRGGAVGGSPRSVRRGFSC